jgi:hypothetical protein
MRKIYFIALLAISACAPVYVPNVRNSPMFTKGGEFQASVQIGNGWEGQSAYAINDHFGLMANFSYANRTGFDPDTEDDDYHRHQLFEGGAGYFSNRTDSFFEVFAGYGAGEGSSVDTYDDLFGPQSVAATGKYKRYFLQPAFGINGKEIDVSFATRFSMVDFYKFSNESYSMVVNEEPKFFCEPAIIGRANMANNHMFVIFQGGVSLGLSENIYFSRRSFQFSTGIGLRLGGKKELVSRTD